MRSLLRRERILNKWLLDNTMTLPDVSCGSWKLHLFIELNIGKYLPINRHVSVTRLAIRVVGLNVPQFFSLIRVSYDRRSAVIFVVASSRHRTAVNFNLFL
jgi:hypothetical protein